MTTYTEPKPGIRKCARIGTGTPGPSNLVKLLSNLSLVKESSDIARVVVMYKSSSASDLTHLSPRGVVLGGLTRGHCNTRQETR